MVTLKKIAMTSGEMPVCIALDVAPHQKDFVYPNAIMLALDYEYNAKNMPMECRAIYADGNMVGLIAYNYYVNDPVFKETCYRIRPVMIDKNQQDRGYEAAALQKLLEEIKTKPHGEATAIFVSYDPEEEAMANVYAQAGFAITNLNWDAEDPDDNDVIARMSL